MYEVTKSSYAFRLGIVAGKFRQCATTRIFWKWQARKCNTRHLLSQLYTDANRAAVTGIQVAGLEDAAYFRCQLQIWLF